MPTDGEHSGQGLSSENRKWKIIPLAGTRYEDIHPTAVRIQGDIGRIGALMEVERILTPSLRPRMTIETVVSNYEDLRKICVRTFYPEKETRHLYKSEVRSSPSPQLLMPGEVDLNKRIVMPFSPKTHVKGIEGALFGPGSNLVIHRETQIGSELVACTSVEIVLYVYRDAEKVVFGTLDPIADRKLYYLIKV